MVKDKELIRKRIDFETNKIRHITTKYTNKRLEKYWEKGIVAVDSSIYLNVTTDIP